MKHAFSLVELSIVLVILGLLTGGILGGQALIRAAELRAAGTELDRYRTATNSFRDKFFALPGDITNAQSFWGATTCPSTAGSGTQTCNGNGNGQVDSVGAGSQYVETFTFWQHLANAGLIEGSYSGMSGPGGRDDSKASNSPSSRLKPGLWFIAHDATSVAAMFPIATTRNNFRLGTPSATSHPDNGLFKPEEQWNIDTKYDDGKPGLGIVTSPMASYRTNCASNSTAATSEYVLTHTSATCVMYVASGI